MALRGRQQKEEREKSARRGRLTKAKSCGGSAKGEPRRRNATFESMYQRISKAAVWKDTSANKSVKAGGKCCDSHLHIQQARKNSSKNCSCNGELRKCGINGNAGGSIGDQGIGKRVSGGVRGPGTNKGEYLASM